MAEVKSANLGFQRQMNKVFCDGRFEVSYIFKYQQLPLTSNLVLLITSSTDNVTQIATARWTGFW